MIQLLMRSDFRNIAVRSDAQSRVADIGDRNERRNFVEEADSFAYSKFWRRNKFRFIGYHKIEPYINIQPEPRLFPFQLRHCLLEQLAVQVETDRPDVAALSCAQDAAGAANLQVAHGNAKTRAQRAVLFDGADPLARGTDCHHFAREKQIGVCLVLGSADASTQLIQIGETKLICPIDDDGVCIRNIEPAFNDRGANEHIGFASDESCHDRFQLVCVHLAMSDFNCCLWATMDDPVARSIDSRYAIVEKEELPLAFQFAIDCSANDSFIVGRDHGFYGQTVERRGLNCGHVFCAYERKVEGAWNRRR